MADNERSGDVGSLKFDAWSLYCAAFHALNGERAKVELSPAALQEMVETVLSAPAISKAGTPSPQREPKP